MSADNLVSLVSVDGVLVRVAEARVGALVASGLFSLVGEGKPASRRGGRKKAEPAAESVAE